MEEARIPRIEAKSLKAQCVETLERLIISGELAVDALVPPERELALRLGVSRPVVHEAMVELASKGFVRVVPRRGVRVNDFWRHGTLAIFESIILHSEGIFPQNALSDMIAFRAMIELEAVRLAALRGGGESIPDLRTLLDEERRLDDGQGGKAGMDTRVELDIRFHLLLAEASGNRILPLVVNSTIPVYRDFVRRFYSLGPDIAVVRGYHRDIVDAIAGRDAGRAVGVTREMLAHGARSLGIPS